jgi:hypothetical protein
MKRQVIGLLAGAALVAASGAALAHHSFAMFDQDHPMELQGTVTEFKFTSPHTFILLEVKGTDGSSTVWNLEGASPSALVREGWASKTLKAGDELKMTIDPLRSGAPGGSWSEKKTNFSSGQPIVTHRLLALSIICVRPPIIDGRAEPRPDPCDRAAGGSMWPDATLWS